MTKNKAREAVLIFAVILLIPSVYGLEDYIAGQKIDIVITLFNNTGSGLVAVETQACNGSVYFYENSSWIVDDVLLTNNTGGIHNFSFIPPQEGEYGIFVECWVGGELATYSRKIEAQNRSLADYLENIQDNLTYVVDKIDNTIIPYFYEINQTTRSSYNYLQNTLYPSVSDANSTIHDILDKWGSYTASQLYQRIEDTYNKADDVYSDTQALLTKWGSYTAFDMYNISNLTYAKSLEIYSDMATASALSDIGDDVTWLFDNVATQTNITETYSRLAAMNDALSSISLDLLEINLSLYDKMDIIQTDIIWLIDNVATDADISGIYGKLLDINTTLGDTYNYLQDVIYSLLNETSNSTRYILDYIGSPSDSASAGTLFGEHVYTQARLAEINSNLTELKSLAQQIDANSIQINSTVSLILGNIDNLEEMHRCNLNPNSTICSLLNDVKTDTGNIYTLALAIDETTIQINQSYASYFHVRLSDFAEVSADDDFMLKVWITDYYQQPKDADTVPTVMLYDPLRNAMGPFTMYRDEEGIYSFNYTTTSSMTDGVWEAVATTIVNGITNRYSDYWELESSPAEVRINSIIDKTIPTITADVVITNEGTGTQEYQYEYCVVADQANSCGGFDDLYYGSGAKLIYPGQSWNTQLTADEINQTGTLWFKVLVYYGSEVSGASKSFTAIEDSGSSPEGGTSGGGVEGTGGGITGKTDIYPDVDDMIEDVTDKDMMINESLQADTGRIQIVNYPEFIELKVNETIEEEIQVKNIDSEILHNVRLIISGLPSYLYLVSPKTVNIAPGEMQVFKVRIKPSLEEKQYLVRFIVSSDEDSKEVASILNIIGTGRTDSFMALFRSRIHNFAFVIILLIIFITLSFVFAREAKLKNELERTMEGFQMKLKGENIGTEKDRIDNIEQEAESVRRKIEKKLRIDEELGQSKKFREDRKKAQKLERIQSDLLEEEAEATVIGKEEAKIDKKLVEEEKVLHEIEEKVQDEPGTDRLSHGHDPSPFAFLDDRKTISKGILKGLHGLRRAKKQKDVPSEVHFITHEGKPLKNIRELHDYIFQLDEVTFRRFVNEEKNDFYNWIKYAVRDDRLAEKIKNMKDKENLINGILTRLYEEV